MIKELITIANELDKRGLVSEASILDKIAGDILQFDLNRRKKPIDPKPSEEEPGDLIGLNRRPIAPLMPQPETPPWAMSIVPLKDAVHRDLTGDSGGRDFEDEPAPLGWDEIVENNYFENPIVHPNGAEQVVESDEVLNAFIKEYLTPETEILDGDSILEHILYTDSMELKDYMTEVMPDLISDLSEKLNDGDPPGLHKDRIITLAKEMSDYEFNDDFKYIIDNMKHYLEDYTF